MAVLLGLGLCVPGCDGVEHSAKRYRWNVGDNLVTVNVWARDTL